MRSILDFVRAVLAAAASFTYVLVREGGRLVGKWVRLFQPATPPEYASPGVESTRTSDTPAQKRSQVDGHIYEAIAEVASALAAGRVPRAEAAQLIDNDTHDWLALLSPSELNRVGQLSPATLRAHLTGRAWVPALLRTARGEMTERAEMLVRRRLSDANHIDPNINNPALAAGI